MAAFAPFVQYDPDYNGTLQFSADVSVIDTETREAIYAVAMSTKGQDYTTSYTCLTDDCTWNQPYQTLAVCSTCYKITDKLDSNDDRYKLPKGFSLANFTEAGSGAYVNMTTTSGDFLDLGGRPNRYEDLSVDPIEFGEKGAVLADVFAIASPPNRDDHYGPRFGLAFECMQQLCVKEFTVRRINNTLVETETSDSPWTNNSGSAIFGGHDTVPLETIYSRPPGTSRTFLAAFNDYEHISVYIASILRGAVSPDVVTAKPWNDIVNNAAVQLGAPNGSIELTMSKIASSISKTMRALSTKERSCSNNDRADYSNFSIQIVGISLVWYPVAPI